MSDDYTTLNAGAGGSVMDETGVDFSTSPTPRKRPRVVIAGEDAADLAPVINHPPQYDSYGLVVRTLVGKEYPGVAVWQPGEVTLVSAESETTVTSYTVPTGYRLFITSWYFSGDVNAKYTLYAGSSKVISMRSTSAVVSMVVPFQSVRPNFNEGTVVTVKVVHSASGLQANFDAMITGYLLSNSIVEPTI